MPPQSCLKRPSAGNAPGQLRESLALAWPQTLKMLAQYSVALADVVAAGHIGKEVQASLGLMSLSLFVFLVAALALANGAVALISQSLGAGLRQRANRYAVFILGLAAGFGVVFTLALSLARPSVLELLNVPAAILPVAGCFLDAYLCALPAYYLLLTSNGIFQAYGHGRVPLASMCLVAVLNAVLDFGLGLGMWGFPQLGYTGVAWATCAAVGAGALLNLLCLRRLGLLRRGGFPPARWMRRAWDRLCRCSWPAGATHLAWQGSLPPLYAILGALPGDPVGPLAGFAAGMRIDSIVLMPAHALALTAAIVVGKTLGMGGREQARALAQRLFVLGVAFSALVAVALWWLRGPLAGLVAPDAAAKAHALSYLTYFLPSAPFAVGAILLGGVMNGAGASLFNLVSFALAGWLVRLPLAYLLTRAGWLGAEGVWLSLGVSQACQCLCLLHVLQRRNWRGFGMRPGRPLTRRR